MVDCDIHLEKTQNHSFSFVSWRFFVVRHPNWSQVEMWVRDDR